MGHRLCRVGNALFRGTLYGCSVSHGSHPICHEGHAMPVRLVGEVDAPDFVTILLRSENVKAAEMLTWTQHVDVWMTSRLTGMP